MNRRNAKELFAGVNSFMIINSIEITGFKNISTVKINFDSLMSLVAPNGYGKSNVLNAIEFGIDFINQSAKTRDNMMRFKPCIPINKNMNNCKCNFVFNMQDTSDASSNMVEYAFSFAWQNDQETAGNIVSETLKIKSLKNKEVKFTNYIIRNEKVALYKTSKTGRCTKKINIKPNELVLTKLNILGDLYYSEIINKIADLTFYVEDRMDVGDCFDVPPFRNQDYVKGSLKIEDMDDIPRYIFYLKENYSEKYYRLESAFKMLFPSILNVEIRQYDVSFSSVEPIPANVPFKIDENAYKLLMVDDNMNQPIPFEYLSAGTKKVFVFLAAILAADINKISLIAIEEIENSIHPILMKDLINIIEQFAGNTKIIITSHSPYIIDCLQPSELYLPIPNDEGLAKFGNINKPRQAAKLIKDAKSNDNTIGEYIFSLLSGDKDDFEIMKSYLSVQS